MEAKRVLGSNWEISSIVQKIIENVKQSKIENLQTTTEFLHLLSTMDQFSAVVSKSRKCESVAVFNNVKDEYKLAYKRFRLEADALSVSVDAKLKVVGEHVLSQIKSLGLNGYKGDYRKIDAKRVSHIQQLVKAIRLPEYQFATNLQLLLTDLEAKSLLFIQNESIKQIDVSAQLDADTATRLRPVIQESVSQFAIYCKAMAITTKLPAWIKLSADIEVLIVESTPKSKSTKKIDPPVDSSTTENVA